MSRIGTHIQFGDWSESNSALDTYQVFISNGNANYKIKKLDREVISSVLGDSKTMHVHAPYCINLAIQQSPEEDSSPLKEQLELLLLEEKTLGEDPLKRGNIGKLKKLGVQRRKVEKELSKLAKGVHRSQKDVSILEKSYNSLRDILVQIEGLPMSTVFHFGSRGSMSNVVKYIRRLQEEGHLKPGCDRVPVKLLGEVSAGEGSSVGKTWEELEEFYSQVDKSLVGLCLDTAHLFGSGMCDFRTRYSIDELFARCDSLGVRIGLIHFNDANTHCGSLKDKHMAHLFGQIWNPDNYWYFISVCSKRGIDLVSESSPGLDYSIIRVVKMALPYVPESEDAKEDLKKLFRTQLLRI